MSFNRLNYDTSAYTHRLKESIGPGEYMLDRNNFCEPCFVPSPEVRIDRFGASICPKDLVDVDSELLGITRKASECPSKKYLPLADEFCKKTNLRECNALDPENTRLSNPPCTLKCRGINRWESLCKDPQENVEVPFHWNVNNRLVVKDNWRPCIPKPLDQTLALPEGKRDNTVYKGKFCGIPDPSPHPLNYRSCRELKHY
jgi:hypothetical protein